MVDAREIPAEAAELLKAMSNPRRLLILCHLHEEELCVSDLCALVDLGQSALSQHLAKLREDGLVTTRREAQCIYYRLASEPVRAVIAVLHDLYCKENGV